MSSPQRSENGRSQILRAGHRRGGRGKGLKLFGRRGWRPGIRAEFADVRHGAHGFVVTTPAAAMIETLLV